MRYLLGIDIGTFESKGCLVDETGVVVAQAARPHKMLVPRAGWAEHDPEADWWGDFVFIARALLEKSGIDPADIAGIGTSAIGPCMLPVDGNGNPLMNGVLYGVDNRASKQVDELTREIGEAVLIERCGNALTSQSVGPKILWLKQEHPEIFARTDRIHTSTTFIVNRLTGRCVIDHYTAASFAPLYDVEQQCWTSDICDRIIDTSMLPEILWSNEIAGTVTAQAADQTGLAQGTPVLTGTIDAAAEALSVGVVNPGEMMMMYGSTIFIIMPTASRVSDPRLWYAPWLFEGQHASMAGLATSGTLTHWFREQFARDLEVETAFGQLASEAEASPPGANGLLVHPYFSGERTPIHDPLAKGSIFGLNLTHTRGDVYRALLEGVANSTNHILQTYREIGHPPDKVFAVGGGTKNRIWLQSTSDISGHDQLVCQKTFGASYGNAYLAGLATNLCTISDILSWNPIEETVKAVANKQLDKNYELFCQFYEQTKAIAHDLPA